MQPGHVTADVLLATSPNTGESEHSRRISLLRQRMLAENVTAVALASPENIYYLTGLDHLGYFAFTLLVLPLDGTPIVVTRAMERPTIQAQVPWCRHVAFHERESPAAVAVSVLADLIPDGGTVAIDDDSMFFPPAVDTALRGALPGLRWLRASQWLADQRAVKSSWEIEQMRRAAAISDLAIGTALTTIRPGVRDLRVAAEAYRAMIEAGGQTPGFPPLIRPTELLDQEHVSWSGRTIRPGDGLFMELSASVHRYHAPQSRTVYVGHAPSEAADAADAAMAGLLAARDALRPGARTGEVYSAWQRTVAGNDAPTWPLRHHCGYLVGVGFPPSWVGGGSVLGIGAGGEVEIAAGMTFHLMSWVTQPVGHVISDTALVTPSGAELLTTTARELLTIA